MTVEKRDDAVELGARRAEPACTAREDELDVPVVEREDLED